MVYRKFLENYFKSEASAMYSFRAFLEANGMLRLSDTVFSDADDYWTNFRSSDEAESVSRFFAQFVHEKYGISIPPFRADVLDELDLVAETSSTEHDSSVPVFLAFFDALQLSIRSECMMCGSNAPYCAYYTEDPDENLRDVFVYRDVSFEKTPIMDHDEISFSICPTAENAGCIFLSSQSREIHHASCNSVEAILVSKTVRDVQIPLVFAIAYRFIQDSECQERGTIEMKYSHHTNM